MQQQAHEPARRLHATSRPTPCCALPPPATCSCADALLRNLYRWVCSPASRLYDPALKQVRAVAYR